MKEEYLLLFIAGVFVTVFIVFSSFLTGTFAICKNKKASTGTIMYFLQFCNEICCYESMSMIVLHGSSAYKAPQVQNMFVPLFQHLHTS